MKDFDVYKYIKKSDYTFTFDKDSETQEYVSNAIHFRESYKEKLEIMPFEDALTEEECETINRISVLDSKRTVIMLGDESDCFLDSVNWRGYVEHIDRESETILGRMLDISTLSRNTIEEHVTFSFKDISSDDMELLREGAIFYYSVGYAENRGQRTKQQVIRFQRVTANTSFYERQKKEIETVASELVKKILWE